MKYKEAVGWVALTAVLYLVGAGLIVYGMASPSFDWVHTAWGMIPVMFGLMSMAVASFCLTPARLECKVALMKSGKYKAKNNIKKLKKERRKMALEMLKDRDGPEYYMRQVLLAEKRIAEAQGKSWDPPEHYRNVQGLN